MAPEPPHSFGRSFRKVEWGTAAAVLAEANVLLTVQPPSMALIQAMKPGTVGVGFMQPHAHIAEVKALRDGRITTFAMELVPRISRAQSMDALSSQASIAGYKAVLIAATRWTASCPCSRPPPVPSGRRRGAGHRCCVAGLQAIATARRLGAMVEATTAQRHARGRCSHSVRSSWTPGVSAEGTGGYARELTAAEQHRQQEVLDSRIAVADAVITTAAIPGRQAPRLISRAAVERMKAGAVIVDLAAESGGNCELTRAGEVVLHGAVRIVGPVNLPAQLAYHASEMYARNIFNFVKPALDGSGDPGH
ncbi:MAG: hypothetical protein WDM77_11590 [Steroidobacteraceae bacterium]